MRPQSRTTRLLRAIRGTLAAAIAWPVAAFPSLEPLLVRLGLYSMRKSRLLAGLYWFVQEDLLARLRRSGERYRPVFVRGRRLLLDITDPTGRSPFFYRREYEPGVTDAIATALRQGDVFVDVGANIGYFTVLAAAIVGDRGRVIAFEPHDGAREALEEAIHRNGASPIVQVVPLALADADGEAELFVADAVTAHSTIEPALSPMRHMATLRAGTMVRMTTLDGWMKAHPGLAWRVRCVKIDVQGAEARALAGMGDLLRTATPSVLCETALGSQADRVLAAAGYRWRRIEPGASTYGNFLYLRP